jgi:hypothetical protein
MLRASVLRLLALGFEIRFSRSQSEYFSHSYFQSSNCSQPQSYSTLTPCSRSDWQQLYTIAPAPLLAVVAVVYNKDYSLGSM